MYGQNKRDTIQLPLSASFWQGFSDKDQRPFADVHDPTAVEVTPMVRALIVDQAEDKKVSASISEVDASRLPDEGEVDI